MYFFFEGFFFPPCVLLLWFYTHEWEQMKETPLSLVVFSFLSAHQLFCIAGQNLGDTHFDHGSLFLILRIWSDCGDA